MAEAIGAAGMTDALGVASIFNAVDRVADATGVELDNWKQDQITDFDHLPAQKTA